MKPDTSLTPPLSVKILAFLLGVRFTSAFLGSFAMEEPPSVFATWRIALYLLITVVIAIPARNKKYPVWFSGVCWGMITSYSEQRKQDFSGRRGPDYVFLWFLFFALMAEGTKLSFKQVTTFRDVNWIMLTTPIAIIPIVFGLLLFF